MSSCSSVASASAASGITTPTRGPRATVPSHLYEFSFAPIRAGRAGTRRRRRSDYLEDAARSYGVLDRIRTGTEVSGARWR